MTAQPEALVLPGLAEGQLDPPALRELMEQTAAQVQQEA